MIFPFLDANVEVVNKEDLPLYKEIAWDFKSNTPIIENNDFKMLEGKDALEVWVYKTIKTSRFEHEIYSWNYGCEISNLIGKGFTKALIVSEVERYIQEALGVNEYIKEIKSISVDLSNDEIKVELSLNSYYGEVRMSV